MEITACHRRQTRQVLNQLGMTNFMKANTPMNPNAALDPPPENYTAPKDLLKAFQSLIGVLNWIAGMTRPEIAFTVRRLSRFLVNCYAAP